MGTVVRLATLLGLLAAAALPGCFTPEEPACAFTCVRASHLCPAGYTCDLATGLCMNPKGKGACALVPVVDGGASDTAAD